MLSFFHLIFFCFFVKNQVFVGVRIDIWIFSSVPLVLLSALMPIQRLFSVLYLCSKVRDCDASRSSFIVQDCSGYPGFFAFPYEFEYHSFEVCEEFCWDFDGHCVESVDCFW